MSKNVFKINLNLTYLFYNIDFSEEMGFQNILLLYKQFTLLFFVKT